MKYRKYILILLLVIFIGLNRVEAEECYYIGENFKARMDSGNKSVTINNFGGKIDATNKDILNWGKKGKLPYMGGQEVTVFSSYDAKQCPVYLILSLSSPWSGAVFATDDKNEINVSVNGRNLAIVYGSYLHDDGTPITKEEYYGSNVELPTLPNTENCYQKYEICIKSYGIQEQNMCSRTYELCINRKCNDIFGKKDDEESLAYLINKVLGYVRIIVPILIIVLGMIDLAKAVIASKEDEMRKAQKTFVKRLIIGVVVFFIPVLVNLLMSLADMIWENYSSCGIDNIIK